MAAAATHEQKKRASRDWYLKLQRIAARSPTLTYTRERGCPAVITDADGWKYQFRVDFSNASNGETFSRRAVTVFPPGDRPARTFDSYSWTGSAGNQSLGDFWRVLAPDARRARLIVGRLRVAYEIDAQS